MDDHQQLRERIVRDLTPYLIDNTPQSLVEVAKVLETYILEGVKE